MSKEQCKRQPDFQLLFESGSGLYLALTADLRIVAASDAYLTATMTTREAILGRALSEIFPDHPLDANASAIRNLTASLQRVLQETDSDTMAIQQYDVRRPEAQGGVVEERFWKAVNSPILEVNGQIAYILHRVEDVTDLVRLEEPARAREKLVEELRARAEQMEAELSIRRQEVSLANSELSRAKAELGGLYERTRELDRLKAQFFANVSHELRTPLALIFGPVEMLAASAGMTDDMRSALDVVLRNARLLLKHVNDLLALSKMEGDKVALDYADLDCAHLVRLTAQHFEAYAGERAILFRIDAEGEIRLHADPEKFQRVLVNLVSNAFKFTPANGQVRCSLVPAGDDIVIEVADSGPGVPAEYREAIFEPFHQLDGGASRRHGGTGLGLAIVKEFVSLHGGSVSVGDAPEGGALFRVRLPTRAPAGTTVAPAVAGGSSTASNGLVHAFLEFTGKSSQSQITLASESDGRPLALVVEGNPEMNRFVRQVLESEYRTVSAVNGQHGLRKAINLAPDLIVSDVMLPVMSGDELVREVRMRPELRATPIILLSAKADDALHSELLRLGANDYVTKPFSAAELLARARNLVSLRESLGQNRQLTAELEKGNAHLGRALGQLAQANEELESFSYSVSHDLRAPLRAINGFSHALLTDFPEQLNAQGRNYLNRVNRAAERMADLIENLLELSRVGRAEIQKGKTDLSDIARKVAADLRKAEPQRLVRIDIPDGLFAEVDRRLIRVVLDNLLSNAWKFTSKTAEPEVHLKMDFSDEGQIFSVRDNGAGFDMNYMKKLFQPFQRLHTETQFPGNGIGLATVRRIIDRHGGRVWAESSVGCGTTIYFNIPSGAGPSDEPVTMDSAGRGHSPRY